MQHRRTAQVAISVIDDDMVSCGEVAVDHSPKPLRGPCGIRNGGPSPVPFAGNTPVEDKTVLVTGNGNERHGPTLQEAGSDTG